MSSEKINTFVEKLPSGLEISMAEKEDSFQILELQKKNVQNGLFQWEMSTDYLDKYLDFLNTIIAKYEGKVVAYLLTLRASDEIFKETPYLQTFEYVLDVSGDLGMKTCFGQLCVDEGWRRKGVSKKMHQAFKKLSNYDVRFLVIHDDNTVSYDAHEKRNDTLFVKRFGEHLEDCVFALQVRDLDMVLERQILEFIDKINKTISL